MQRSRFFIIVGGVIVATLLIVGGVILANRVKPLAVVRHYPAGLLLGEARQMTECAECHAAADFHTCATCHDDHGAVEFEDVPFYAGITFTGDVPAPGYILLNDILPYQNQPHTHVPLVAFLEQQGVTEFESVTMVSGDGGVVTVSPENLTEDALLMPYIDGIRFAAENLHVSSWLKGITRMVVVGQETPLLIDGEATSMGRLLTGPVVEITTEEAEVMLRSEEDGQIRRAQTAGRLQGAPVARHVADPAFEHLIVRVGSGDEHSLSAAEAGGAALALLRGETTLVLPGRARNQWLAGVVELRTE